MLNSFFLLVLEVAGVSGATEGPFGAVAGSFGATVGVSSILIMNCKFGI
jgi:hypothetical protein